MNDFLFHSIFIASVALVWKNLQKDFPSLGKYIHSLPWALMKSVHCSFCVIYWMSLFAVLFLHRTAHFNGPQTVYQWFILGFTSYLIYTISRAIHFTMEILYEKYTALTR